MILSLKILKELIHGTQHRRIHQASPGDYEPGVQAFNE